MSEFLELKSASVASSKASWLLRLHLRNCGREGLWLIDRLFRVEKTGLYRIDPWRAYVHGLEGKSLLASKMLVAVPPGVHVEFPEIPCVTWLPAGEALTETLAIPIPLAESLPYATTPPRALGIAHSVRVKLGYLPGPESLDLHRGADIAGLPFAYPDYSSA
ncbi:MAG: hypothetical protein HY901_17615, partial [Deltaproteobacteria bacterium]|nr:hypothetical protein [Deltaproteobacteria bacterium]